LREAISFMTLHQVASVNLVDASGLHAGVLHAADIFTGHRVAA
jgi:osmoprotectant transport system ATP-binding protein